MFYECIIRVIEHSSVNVRLMLTNILRQKVGNSSERSQNAGACPGIRKRGAQNLKAFFFFFRLKK